MPPDIEDNEFMSILRKLPPMGFGSTAEPLPQFDQHAVGIYLHGLLIGVSRAQSYAQAHMAAARQALATIERMIANSLVLGERKTEAGDDGIQLIVGDQSAGLNFGTRCSLCCTSNQ